MKLKKLLFLIIAACLFQAAPGQKADKKSDKPVTIAGLVVNKDHVPIVGAVLYIDNIRTSNITNNDGKYKIKVSRDAIKLGVRSSQYGNCETAINDQTKINFTLNGDESKALFDSDEKGENESGQKTARKRMNTYNDIYQMIRGEVSGVVVSGRSVQIQQGKSFFGSSTPLFVVNGIVVNSIDNINPLEVKSIAVLKGSSAAIYGVRGANGVISITLINGSEKEK